MTNKLRTNFHFPKLDKVDEKDRSLALFGIFMRTVERCQRKEQYVTERHRLRNEGYSCCICKSTETVRTKNGIKIWYRHNGQHICIYCKSRMRRQSEETKRKQSESKIGPKNPNYRRYGLLNPLFGKSNPKLAGPNNRKWRGGITELNNRIRTCTKYGEWRARVFDRDGYKCKRCGSDKGGDLIAHHIKPYREIMKQYDITTFEEAMACYELWDIDNGITVCEKCHIEIESGAAW